MYDLLIKNGTLIDGSGAAPFAADLAIQNGKIAKIAPSIDLSEAAKAIDATGLTVTPGFIDSHSHSDRAILTWPDQKEKLEQGITLSVTGQCGSSPAPQQTENGFYRMSDFLQDADRVPQGSGALCLVGHGSIRAAVLHNENRRPTAAELEQMKALLCDAMESGCLGMSLGLIYIPGSYAETEELIALAKIVAEYNGLITAHIRNEADYLLEAVTEFITIIKASGARGVISHLKAMERHNWGKVTEAIRLINDANASGCDIYCDVYPYCASSTNLQARVLPALFHPPGTKNALDLLHNEEIMAQIRQWAKERWHGDLSWILISACNSHPEYVGKRLNEIAAMRGSNDQLQTAYELLQENTTTVSGCFFMMCEEDMEQALAFERAMICTDSSCAEGKTSYHPRLRASFIRVLAHYVRERGIVSLPEMIRKMTSLPAAVYGLTQKGLLAPGYDADLNLFDYEALQDQADFADCTAPNAGLRYVLVAGEIAVTDGVHNGLRRAAVLRKTGNISKTN